MSLPHLISRVFQQPELQDQPPVLIDIGASSGLNPKWKQIAPHCVCVAFDPDDRDFQYVEKRGSDYKRLVVVNKVVVGRTDGAKQEFYLTKNPYCSSLLRPRLEQLREFSYAESFEVARVAQVEAVDLPQVLADLKVPKFDWIKIDSQGVDLRLLSSLPPAVQDAAVALELEPGLIHTYAGEDKLGPVLNHLDNSPFYLVDLKVCTAMRVPAGSLAEVFPSPAQRKLAELVLPRVPAWTEIAFLNRLRDEAPDREFLLAWVFATVLGHDECALVYARRAVGQGRRSLFEELCQYSAGRLRGRLYRWSGLQAIGAAATRKLRKTLGMR